MWSDILYFTGITIAVYLGLKYLLPIVIPFLLAAGIASLLHPLVCKLEKRVKLPHGFLSAAAVGLAVLFIGLPILFLIYKLMLELCHIVGGYRTWKGEVENIWCMCCDRIRELSGLDASALWERGSVQADSLMKLLQEKVVPYAMNCSISGLRGIAGFLWKTVVTLVAAVLMLADYTRLRAKFMQTAAGRVTARIGGAVTHAGGRYLRAQLIIWCAVSTICVVGLLLGGNRYALLAGIGIGFCDALPFVGTGIIFVPWLILKVITGEYALAVLYGVLYIICSVTREFLEPKLVGKGLGVHPLAVIFSIYIGICIYGGIGILLGPLSALLIWEVWQMRGEMGERKEEDNEKETDP